MWEEGSGSGLAAERTESTYTTESEVYGKLLEIPGLETSPSCLTACL